MPRLREGKLRLSRHYLGVLSALSDSYEEGGEARITSLRRFSEERMQIEAAQRWASTQMDRNVLAAEICSNYCEVDQSFLLIVLSPKQRTSWYEAAVIAADILHRPDL